MNKTRKSKVTSYLLAIFLGGLGGHLFYLERPRRGIVYLLLSWTGVSMLLSLLDLFFISKWVDILNGGNKAVTTPDKTQIHPPLPEKNCPNETLVNPNGNYTDSNIDHPKQKIEERPNEINSLTNENLQQGNPSNQLRIQTKIKRDGVYQLQRQPIEALTNKKRLNKPEPHHRLAAISNAESEKPQNKIQSRPDSFTPNYVENNYLKVARQDLVRILEQIQHETISRLIWSINNIQEKKQIFLQPDSEVNNLQGMEQKLLHADYNNTKKNHSYQKDEDRKKINSSGDNFIEPKSTDIYLKEDEEILPIFKKEVDPIQSNSHVRPLIEILKGTIHKEEIRKHANNFYCEEKIILPEYQSLRTPAFVNTQYQHLKNKKKNSPTYASFEYYSNEKILAQDSIKFANMRGDKKAVFVPFMQYYPTFRSLNPEQKIWYFFWREEVLNGRYPDTDLSYIYLFVYELMNYSFHQKAAFNISLMVRIYEQYIERYPSLIRYLPTWIGHMLIETGEKGLAQKWLGDMSNSYSFKKMKNTLLETENWSVISMSLWKSYMLNRKETPFYSENKLRIYKIFKAGIELYRQFVSENGISLVDQWFQEEFQERSFYLFPATVVYRENDRYAVLPVKVLKPTKEMRVQLIVIMRQSENILRSMNNNRLIKVEENVVPMEFLEKMKEEVLNKDNSFSRFKKVQSKTIQNGSKIPAPPLPA